MKWQYLCNAMDMALALGDYQKDSNHLYTPEEFCEVALDNISSIIDFSASAIYLVEAESSDLVKSAFAPADQSHFIDDEMNFLIEQGIIAWAIRERRGITVFSRNGKHQLQLHVIATYARIRGLFIGIFPEQLGHRPDGASEFLSLMLRSVATSLESIAYVTLLNQKNDALHQEVDAQMKMLISKERELANTRKLNAIASLAGGIAHEFNNMLTSLIGYNDLTRMDPDDGRMVLQYAEKSATGLDRLASLTSQLLSYSRGSMYKTEQASLTKLIEDVIYKLKGPLKEAIRIDTTSSPADVQIKCDIGQIHQAIAAVLINAMEAIEPDGKITIKWSSYGPGSLPEPCRSKLSPGEYLMVSIEDNGAGMDLETKERMFEPFFSTKFTGRGLSMAAVYGILENHGGTIIVESQIDVGTTVDLYLPMNQ